MEERSMVERKLSGIWSIETVEIKYAWFERFVKQVHESLADHTVDIDMAEIANNPGIISGFQAGVKEHLESYHDDDNYVGDPWGTCDNVYCNEILAKREEQERLVQEQSEANNVTEIGANVLPIRSRHRAKAIQLLKDAGYYNDPHTW